MKTTQSYMQGSISRLRAIEQYLKEKVGINSEELGHSTKSSPSAVSRLLAVSIFLNDCFEFCLIRLVLWQAVHTGFVPRIRLSTS